MTHEVALALSFSLSLQDEPVQPAVVSTQVLTIRNGHRHDQADWLAAEEPLEIRVQGPEQEPVRVAVTMRTPGHDQALAVGFLYSEGLLTCRDAVVAVNPGEAAALGAPCNIVTVHLAHTFDATALQRNFLATSSCGVCGKIALEQIALRCAAVEPGPFVPASLLVHLSGHMRQTQQLFARTGGVHAAGLFDRNGQLLALQEDVGRHNAVDKLIGEMLLAGQLPLAEQILLVSGRTSFEILQKTAMAGIPILCAVSAPSSLAVSMARRFGITMVGFLRDSCFNIYTHPQRIVLKRS